jgi:predicted enzyme related to lactoylglutathione lyase
MHAVADALARRTRLVTAITVISCAALAARATSDADDHRRGRFGYPGVYLERTAPMLKKVAFTMYKVTDAQRARAFYEDTLGLTRGSSAANGAWTEYDLPGGGCLALFASNEARPDAGAGGNVAFEVEDLDALIARLKTAGVQFTNENIVSPVCRMATMLDSEGNSIILHELKKK